jgi:hypothetical protein
MNEPDPFRKTPLKILLAQRGPSTHESQLSSGENPESQQALGHPDTRPKAGTIGERGDNYWVNQGAC